MARLRWMTAGESHGHGILALVEGIPAGLAVDLGSIDQELKRRQGGFGRGKRMEIELDRVQLLSGCKRGKTLGSPLTLLIKNRDERIDQYRELLRPRPGHADLAGAMKYATPDCSDVMERASARETAARVAAGAVARQLLSAAGVEVVASVVRIGELLFESGRALSVSEYRARRDRSAIFSTDSSADPRALPLIERCREDGDTLGGVFEVLAFGCPPGLGSPMQWDLRLDGKLAQALMSIQAIKAVEVGAGVGAGEARGLSFHDPILPGFVRPTNNAGGIEGGMSNGEPILVRATMKPIPSVKRPLPSVDLKTLEAAPAVYERSDVCSVPAASVVGEAMVALILAGELLEKCGGDTLDEVLRNLSNYRGASPFPAADG